MNKVLCVIPARMASVRYPGKPLARLLGHPMIEHVYRRVKVSTKISRVIVATCDQEIADVVHDFGGEVVMTSIKHTRGTDRVAEAAEFIDADWVINVQGDEPMVDPKELDRALEEVISGKSGKVLNFVTPIHDWSSFIDQNVVKSVMSTDNNVLYFSRQPIPHSTKQEFAGAFKQIGIYIFRKESLLEFAKCPQTPLEIIEKIDMMRLLEHGEVINAFVTLDQKGVDLPEHVFLVEQALEKDLLFQRIFRS